MPLFVTVCAAGNAAPFLGAGWSGRITEGAVAVLQGHAVGIRQAVPEDAEVMLAIARRCLALGEFPGVTDHELSSGLLRIAALPETALVATEDGALAGWIIPRGFDLTVAPERRRRGHGTRLVRAALPLAAADGLPNLRLWSPSGIEGPIEFLRKTGFRYAASLWRMRLPASVVARDVTFPDDVVLRPVRPDDDEAFVALANASFAEHPSPVRFTVEGLRFAMAAAGYDPETIQVLAPVADPARLVGFARIDVYPAADGSPEGDVRAIGLLPDWRGRGLGRDLLRWSVAHLRDRGARDVWLSVEAENTAALRLYEAEGFVAEVEWPNWVKPLSSVPRPAAPEIAPVAR